MRIKFEIVVNEVNGTKVVILGHDGSSGETWGFKNANELKKIVADYIKDTYLETKNYYSI